MHLALIDHSRTAGTKGTPTFSTQRDLPTELYLPTTLAPRPIILFSHGNNGNPKKFTQLLEAWAKAGYVVAAPRFPRTSNEGTYDFLDYPKQPGDISFVLDELLKSKFRSNIDTTRVGAAGLSLGGGTTYALIDNPCCSDRRIRAAAVFDGLQFGHNQPFHTNSVPILIMHIDTDFVLPYTTAVDAYRRASSPKYLVTLHVGIHPEPYEDTPSVHDATVIKVSIDFWDAMLFGDTIARARIVSDGTVAGESKAVAG